MLLGRVTHLYRYPTKSLAGESLAHVRVVEDGFENDRIRALEVTNADHARRGKSYRGKEDNGLHLVGEVEAAFALAARRGIELSLAEGGRHFDAAPVSMIFDVWLQEASALCGVELEPLRFRPNVMVRAEPGWAAGEASLVGFRLRLGEVVLEAIEPILRCVTPSYDLETGESNPAILRSIVQDRANVMGIYCSVVVPGRLEKGALVETV